MEIRKIAVLGSGVMGSGIAAHVANAGFEVALLDIVPPDAASKNVLAEKAIERQLKSGGFTHPDNALRITPSNLEDGLDALADADWIIEAVLEKLEVKQQVYRTINAKRKKGSVVSSNTSTIPLEHLTEGLGEEFAKDCMITHFFNPPRHMRLLEVVKGAKTRSDAYESICKFADAKLGKQVVECKDTPGFIANRIGIYWMIVGLNRAFTQGITVERADAVMSRPVGIPKTGIFGLYDLIGIDLIPLIAKEMLDTLPADDPFRTTYEIPDLVQKMIAEGYTGRKGKGGFYRLKREGGKKITEVMGLKRIHYREVEKDLGLESLDAAKKGGLQALVDHEDQGGRYAWQVLSRTLTYAASLVPEISDTIVGVDEAMKSGYSWQWGPFELIDLIGVDYMLERLQVNDREVPEFLKAAKGKTFYRTEKGKRQYLGTDGKYHDVPTTSGHLWLEDIKRGSKPLEQNKSGTLWDLGGGIAGLEITTKMNAVDQGVMDALEAALDRTGKDFKGLVIGSDGPHFSAGANIQYFLDRAQAEDWEAISSIIRRGQQLMMRMKQEKFPVVSALAGLALGGGCEITLHSTAVQAHIESYPGLVEPAVGLIPAWGGCKEMLLRHKGGALQAFNPIINVTRAGSAQEAASYGLLNVPDASGDLPSITFNRARLLADAKARCLLLAKSHKKLAEQSVKGGGTAAKQEMLDTLDRMAEEGKASPHDLVIGRVLAHVLSAGEESSKVTESQLLELEREGFMELIRTTASQERIAHMLKTGKPLKN